MSDINLSYRTSVDGQQWSAWSRTEENLDLELIYPQITIEETEEGKVESSSYVQKIEPIDLSEINNLSFEFVTNSFEESVELGYGSTLYSINQEDENTLGLWNFDEHESEEPLIVEDITEQILFGEEGGWNIDILLQSKEGSLEGDILAFGEESDTLSLSLSSGELEVDIRGFKSKIISDLKHSREYLITLSSSEEDIRLYINGIYIEDIRQGESEIGENVLTIYPNIMDIKTLHVSDIARTERDIRQLYEYIMGQRSYTFNVSFKANLSTVNSIDNLEDVTFVIDERAYGSEESIENLNVGESIVISEVVLDKEYKVQGIVESLDTQTGEVTVEQWQEGSTLPTEGFSENSKVYRWQKEYITLKDVLPEDRDSISYFTLKSSQDEVSSTLFKDFKAIEYSDISLFEPIENIQYIQYQITMNRKSLDISPFLTEVEVIHSIPGPTMDQVMRHGKWFNSSGERQPFWWVGEN
jgi:hypothetical protein